MLRTITVLVVAAVIIFSAPCFAQGIVAAGDSAFAALAALQEDAQVIKKSTARIEQDIQGLKDTQVETQKKLGQIEKSGQESLRKVEEKINDSKTEIQKNLSQALGDSLRRVKENLGREIKDSETKTQEKLGEISGGVKKIFYLIIALAIVSVLVIVVISVQKRRDKNIWLTVEVEIGSEKKTFKVLTGYSPRTGVYTSPFTTSGEKNGKRGAIDRNTEDAMVKHYRSAIKKALENPKSDFAVQMKTLLRGGKIKEIR
ncbi:MAG: hypothetical protein PHZ04_01575 [Patescibacteria group bacterium]|nr:hypothetical protein [Patescibacteria group bacterium]MDD5294566.1 hypothetical protein [Patescibacteria group bacterium]MDD5554933.1 hypothetical protein [Patescibacteria group bacterium]